MDQATANNLFQEGGTLIILDMPVGTEFGIDYNSWFVAGGVGGVARKPAPWPSRRAACAPHRVCSAPPPPPRRLAARAASTFLGSEPMRSPCRTTPPAMLARHASCADGVRMRQGLLP